MQNQRDEGVVQFAVVQLSEFIDSLDIVKPLYSREGIPFGLPRENHLTWQHQFGEVVALKRSVSSTRIALAGVRGSEEISKNLYQIVHICWRWQGEAERALRGAGGEPLLGAKLPEMRSTFVAAVMEIVEQICNGVGVPTPIYSLSGQARNDRIENQLDAEDIVRLIQPRRLGGELDNH